jgi:hypothetical protein
MYQENATEKPVNLYLSIIKISINKLDMCYRQRLACETSNLRKSLHKNNEIKLTYRLNANILDLKVENIGDAIIK